MCCHSDFRKKHVKAHVKARKAVSVKRIARFLPVRTFIVSMDLLLRSRSTELRSRDLHAEDKRQASKQAS